MFRAMVSPDRAAALFTTYHEPLVRFLARQTGDRDQAEEIAQEVFVRVMRQEELTSERSWLFAVAMNLMRDEARRTARQQKRLELLKNEAEQDSVVEADAGGVEREEERALARRALETLAERDRDALLMREEGLGYDEIASALDLSVGSVGTTLSRARRRLMEAYEALRAPERA